MKKVRPNYRQFIRNALLYTKTHIGCKKIEKIYLAKSKPKKPCIAILISHKMNFKTENIIKGKKAFYNVKVSIHQEQIIILNMYRPSIRASKDMKQKTYRTKGRPL